MVATAAMLGHEYLLITDHSPRLTVAHGLSAERLADQGVRIDAVNEASPVRVLKGIEVDILDTGALDQSRAALANLDLVVASVHSKLSQDAESMTHRMIAAIANPRTNVLGHCTGRLVEGERGLRNESRFDAEVVFEACRQFNVAVEINSRPERRDQPSRLLELARNIGCLFSIDTDAHAPGQLEFLDYGCERAHKMAIPAQRIVNTWPLEELLAWSTS
jgi:putative hydrolase